MDFSKNIESTLFEAAAGLTDPDERTAFLDQTCSGDEGLRRRLESLLASEAGAEDFFNIPLAKMPASVTRMAVLEGGDDTGGRAATLARDSSTLEQIINSQPTLLFYDGRFLEDALSKECITHEEIHAAVREYRLENMDEVRAVVMELNGDLTVVRMQDGVERSSLADVENPKDR